MNLDTLIEDMEQNLSKHSKLFEERIYKDEPIFKRASALKPKVPAQYRQMQRLGKGYDWSLPSECLVFYEQAKFMRDFEDDYDFYGQFFSAYPTYRVMTMPQLRGYFTWRRYVRQGKIPDSAFSFPLLYCYELLMLIGAENEADAYEKLLAFGRAAENQPVYLPDYLKDWLRDFAVYYNLPKEEFLKYADISFDEYLYTFIHCESADDEKLFEALCGLSNYDIRLSPFFGENKAFVTAVLCKVIRRQTHYYNTNRKIPLAEKLFGKVTGLPYTMFASAIFYDSRRYEDYTYEICPLYRYTCTNGVWRLYRCTGSRSKSRDLGLLIKNTEALMREEKSFSSAIVPINLNKPTEKIILSAIEQWKKEEVIRERSTVSIDFSLLNAIRDAAEKTKEKIMTEEERFLPEENPSPVKTAPAQTVNPTQTPPADTALTQTERNFLIYLLKGEKDRALLYAGEQKKSVSMLSDGINEKLYDIYGDTVLDFDGDIPFVIEDYEDELKGRYLL